MLKTFRDNVCEFLMQERNLLRRKKLKIINGNYDVAILALEHLYSRNNFINLFKE
ncbi:MAG: hypothetical protein ACTS78_01905 [Arsenophonus sp. NC-WZS1-MAG3]